MDRTEKTKKVLAGLYVLACAVGLLAVCTQSSPLYPLNGWVDAQCYFTVGKSMMHGQVLYRDIYEQKGPLIFLLHGLASLVERDGFLGVWLFQIAAACCFLGLSYKLLRLFGGPRWAALTALPFVGMAAYTSVSYLAGDSTEEFCIPLLLAGLYCILKALRQRQPVSWRWALATGVLAGCVLWTKYSMLGFYLPWGILMLAVTLRWGSAKQAALNCGMILAGTALATLPWLAYFGANGAMGDWFTAYFYNNIFLYSSKPAGVSAVFANVGNSLRHAAAFNRLQAALIGAGLLWGLVWPLKRGEWGRRLAAPLLFCGLALTTYGAANWVYYFQIFMVFVPLAFVPLVRVGAWLEQKGGLRCGFSAVVCLLGLAVGIGTTFWRTPSRPLLGQRAEDTVQYQFRQIVQAAPDHSMTMRHMLDGGFYTVCDVYPTEKFIGKFNLPLPEMQRELDACVTQRRVEFVAARCEADSWKEYKAEKEPFITENGYVQVADGEGAYLDNGRLIQMRYYLYQREKSEDAP